MCDDECSPSGNNVLRTIHGVGEMMTQMVMSRGVLHSLPDTPPSLRYGKGLLLPDIEDVMVMDTKLKIIEILQVSATCWTHLRRLLELLNCLISMFDCVFFVFFVFLLVHPERAAGLQDHILVVHLQERVWGQEHRRQLRLTGGNAPDDM